MNYNFGYSTDILIFSIDSRTNNNCRQLPRKYFSILLVKREKEPFKDCWCLPGGFIENEETSYEAAKRVLKKETNLTDVYIEQLFTFDAPNRDSRGRIISTSYMALIDKNNVNEKLNKNAKWFDIELLEKDNNINIKLTNEDVINITLKKKLINQQANQFEYSIKKQENIAFDHGLIINKGIIEIRDKANNTDIIFNLMPKEFTIGELKQVYELILGKKLINSAFRRVIAKKIINVSGQVKTGGHRPSNLFTYKDN